MDDRREYEYSLDYVAGTFKQENELKCFQADLKEHFEEQNKLVDIFVPQLWKTDAIIVRVSSKFKGNVDFLSLEGKEYHEQVIHRQRLAFPYRGDWTPDQFEKVAQLCKDNL